ncbi:MAG: response regulator transcription factor [Wenzhouxiangella sp.]
MKRRCILLQECDEYRAATRRWLQSLGYTVLGLETLESVTEGGEYPALVIVDLDQTGSNGFCWIEKLRQYSDDICIIGLSARSWPSAVNACYAAGADAFLTSPVDQRALFSLLQRLMPKEESIAEMRCGCLVRKRTLMLSNGEAEIGLTPAEFRVLWQLERAGLAGLERWELVELFNLDLDSDFSNALEARITRLRNKFRRLDIPGSVIKAQPGSGYVLLIKVQFLSS